jgi:anti-anti-sigma factor
MQRGYRLAVQSLDGVARLRLSGEVDAPDADALVDELVEYADMRSATIVVDATDVDYLGSAGLRSLLAVREYVAERGGRMTIAAASNIVHQVLVVTGTDELFAAGA